MELLKRADFGFPPESTQTEADRVVDVFNNKMMEQLKRMTFCTSRRIKPFLGLCWFNASLSDEQIILELGWGDSIHSWPAACLLVCFGAPKLRKEEYGGKTFFFNFYRFSLGRNWYGFDDSLNTTVQLNDANIYKCTPSSFIGPGLSTQFIVEVKRRRWLQAEVLT